MQFPAMCEEFHSPDPSQDHNLILTLWDNFDRAFNTLLA